VKTTKQTIEDDEREEISQRAYRIAGYLSNYLSEK
jgi:hypothetical protein